MCTVTEYDQTEAWPDALTQGSAIDAPINRYLRFPGEVSSASSWRNEKPRLRGWKLEPNPTAIREGPTERKTAHETTGSTIRRLRGIKFRCWTATYCKGLSARANSGVEDRRECR